MNLTNPAAVIEDNLTRIESRIMSALARAGREGERIQLVIITKGRSPEVVRAAHESGLRIFGENRVDEALVKQRDLATLEDILAYGG